MPDNAKLLFLTWPVALSNKGQKNAGMDDNNNNNNKNNNNEGEALPISRSSQRLQCKAGSIGPTHPLRLPLILSDFSCFPSTIESQGFRSLTQTVAFSMLLQSSFGWNSDLGVLHLPDPFSLPMQIHEDPAWSTCAKMTGTVG